MHHARRCALHHFHDDAGLANALSGEVGDAIGAVCVLWLKAASRCESPESAWPDRITTLVAADEHGAREELLRRCDLLLSEEALRRKVSACEAQLDDAFAHSPAAPRRVSWPAHRASTALSLLSEALRDPDVLVRSMLRHSPSPNQVHKPSLTEAFLKYGRPEGAWCGSKARRITWRLPAGICTPRR